MGPNRTIYQIWGQLDIVCLGFQIQVSSGLIHNVFASLYQTLSLITQTLYSAYLD